MRVGNVWIVPLWSWHHQSFDTEPDIPNLRLPSLRKVGDPFDAHLSFPFPLLPSPLLPFPLLPFPYSSSPCSASPAPLPPAPLSSFQRRAEGSGAYGSGADGSGAEGSGAEGSGAEGSAEGVQIISFSHFLPRIDLLPEKRMLLYPNLAKMAGSHRLEARVRAVHGPRGSPTACHVFGHTHFHWDSWVDGIRYLQAPLCYPRERERRRQAAKSSSNESSSSSSASVKQSADDPWLPFLLYDSSTGGLKTSLLQSHWSNYYRMNPRQPEVTELAPWVAARYAGRMRVAGGGEIGS
ncbi:unnamed protein product [Closterium sp. Yama58-4]|nr:unnamed protein product [Closterium sp. Yama58-4]